MIWKVFQVIWIIWVAGLIGCACIGGWLIRRAWKNRIYKQGNEIEIIQMPRKPTIHPCDTTDCSKRDRCAMYLRTIKDLT